MGHRREVVAGHGLHLGEEKRDSERTGQGSHKQGVEMLYGEGLHKGNS